jgi:hypothetical protein
LTLSDRQSWSTQHCGGGGDDDDDDDDDDDNNNNNNNDVEKCSCNSICFAYIVTS